MPFTDDQNRDHIRELQKFIFSISQYNKKIPTITSDGIYGPQTAAAIGAFQREYELPVTGETDDRTWDKLVKIYFDFKNDTALLDVFPGNLELTLGDKGIVIYIIQVILETLRRRFDNIPKVILNGIYDENTFTAVEAFKKIAGIEKTIEGIESTTWNKLASGFNMMVHKK